MALSNCGKCGGLFNKTNGDICPDCIKEEEALLQLTQAFLKENPDLPRDIVMQALETQGVTLSLINKWIDTRRIVMINPAGEDDDEKCPQCGRELGPGETLCKTCQFKRVQKLAGKDEPTEETSQPEEAPEKKKSPGMHFHKD